LLSGSVANHATGASGWSITDRDKGFDAGWLSERLRANDMEAVIPLREGTSCSIKAFRRIATRYEKTDKCFAAIINLVATVLWTR
jgi:transposase